MRILLASLFALASAAHAQPSINCKSDKGEVSAVYQCDSNRYAVSYTFGEDSQGLYQSQLLTAGSDDFTFEEIASAGEGVATFFVYNSSKGFIGEFGGKGTAPQTFAPGQCLVTESDAVCP